MRSKISESHSKTKSAHKKGKITDYTPVQLSPFASL